MATSENFDLAHLGAVELFTPRFEESLRFFRDICAMREVARIGDSAYLRCWDEYQLYTLKLTASDTNGLVSIDAYYAKTIGLTPASSCGTLTSSATSGSLTCTLDTQNTTYYVYTRATDRAGNVTTSTYTWTVDRTAPVITLPEPDAVSNQTSGSVPFSAVLTARRAELMRQISESVVVEGSVLVERELHQTQAARATSAQRAMGDK